ncbi:MAG: DMT family transporter [Candidatus Thorarchaeota archaeon]
MYGEIMAVLTGISFALSFVLARKIENDATAIFQNTIRSLIGFLTFLIISLSFGVFIEIFKISIFIILFLFLSITFTVIIGDTAYLQSQKFLGPAKALAITTTTPFFTILFEIFFLNRLVSMQMIFSGILIGLGVIIITKKDRNIQNIKQSHSFQSQNINVQNNLKETRIPKSVKGTILALIAAISWAIGIALSDYSINQVDQTVNLGVLSTIIAMMVRFLFASVVLSLISIMHETRTSIPKNRNVWLILIVSAILSYSLGSIFFGEAVHTAGATFMSLISTAMPLFTIPFSYVINKEKISKEGFLGVIITLIGVFILFI